MNELSLSRRYREVIAAAWAARRQLAGPVRLADEVAFLPATLSLQETPPHPAPRRLAWVLMLLFVVTVAWACFGKIDVVAIAPGRIIVSDRTKVIQPLETSVVRRVLVKDGEHVKEGQMLIELDPTAASADKASIIEQLSAATSEAQRTEALLHAMRRGTEPTLQGDTDEAPRTTTQRRLQIVAEWRDINAKLTSAKALVARRKAEIATARMSVTKLESTLPIAVARETDFLMLSKAGAIPAHDAQDRSRQRIELERDLSSERLRLAEAASLLHESESSAAALLAETQRTLTDRNATAVSKVEQLSQDQSKAARRVRLTNLTAPVDGVVQQLAVHTAGGVVTEAQTLMIIVPEASPITAQVEVANLDIGFVNAGQRAEIKLETFPFTKYGTVDASIDFVTSDAVTDEKKGSYFPATLTLDKRLMSIDGKQVRITPGMAITAEIKTSKRRVIEYLLSPIQRTVNEAFIER